jgi:hypothetical protein
LPLFLQNLSTESSWSGIDIVGEELKKCLDAGVVPVMVEVFRKLISDICYDDHSKADSASAGWGRSILNMVVLFLPWGKELKLAEHFRRRMGEGFCRSVLHSALSMSGAKVTPERRVGLGRIELLADCGDLAYVIQLKMAKDAKGGSGGALAEMSRFRERRYGRAFENPVLVAIAVGREERNIVACRYDIEGRETDVEISEP